LASGRVLLLDTNVAYRETLAAALDRFGIEISWRGRILGLFDVLEQCDPVALVMSAELPGSDLIRSVRSSRWSELPIFVIAEEPDRSFELRAYVDGADTVLKRDGSTGELAAHILGHAHRRARRRQTAGRTLADAALALCEERAASPVESLAEVTPAPRNTDAAIDVPTAARLPLEAIDVTPHVNGGANGAIAGPDTSPAGSAPPLRDLADSRFSEAAVPDVILVDDDPSLLEMLRYAMSNRGHKTLSLSNGLDALRTLRELDTGNRRPVVLLDVDLPGLDGFRILHELGICRPGDYQVILCTVHSSEATQVLGIQSGAVDYIVKPFRMPIVLAKVERLLGPARINTGE
jgi:DNA-binding response OmpR family regulator